MKRQLVLSLSILTVVFATTAANSKLSNGAETNSVKGRISGIAFKPSKVEASILGRASVINGSKKEYAETIQIRFREGKDFFADKEILLMFQLPIGTKLSGLKINQKAAKFNSDLYSKQFYNKGNALGHGLIGVHYTIKKPGEDFGDTNMSSGAPEATILLGTQKGDRINGSISLNVDGGKAMIKGTFTAIVKKL